MADEKHERPTVSPPFDVAAYARATAESEAPGAKSPAPAERGRTSKKAHPAGGAPGASRAIAEKTNRSEFPAEEPVSQQVTLTNEIELEQARARSVAHSDPPKRLSGGALAIANARAPSAIPPAGSRPPTAFAAEVRPRSVGADGTAVEGGVVKRGDVPSSRRTPAPEITQRAIEDPIGEMRERFSLGDYSGALEMSELILGADPANLDAAECGENCRSVLESMYAARLGPLDRVPVVMVPNAQMRWLSMDHRAGFILSLIDGSSTVEMILDVSSMQRLDALRIMLDLAQQKIVSFDETKEKPDRHNLEKAKRK